MVKLHPISTTNNSKCRKPLASPSSSTSSSKSQSPTFPSPTSHLPPPLPTTMHPQLPHQFYSNHQNYLPAPPPQPHTVFVPYHYPEYPYYAPYYPPPPPPPPQQHYFLPPHPPQQQYHANMYYYHSNNNNNNDVKLTRKFYNKRRDVPVPPRFAKAKAAADHRHGEKEKEKEIKVTRRVIKKQLWKPREENNKEEHSTLSPPAPAPALLRLPAPVPVLGADCTTVMIKNIPNMVSRRSLISLLDEHCREENRFVAEQSSDPNLSQYDFVYLPFDFLNKRNMGYAFVNFTSAEGASRLATAWTNLGWPGSPKIREITSAKLQGKKSCKSHFQKSQFFCHSEEYLPVTFTPARDGSNGKDCKMTSIGAFNQRYRWKLIYRAKKASDRNQSVPPRLRQ